MGMRPEGRLGRTDERRPRLWDIHCGHRLRKRGLHTSRIFCSTLSTYPLQSSWADLLFDQCITEAVRHLDEAPFLQFVHRTGGMHFTRHSLNKTVAPLKEIWQQNYDHLLFSRPDLMVLVHKVPDEQQPNTYWKLAEEGQSDAAKMPAIFNHRNTGVVSWMQENIIAGKVGDCCDDDHVDHDDELEKTSSNDLLNELDVRKDVAFWGLVVQSHLPSQLNGCYLLKTVRNVDPIGCTCTHFSVNRICNSTPLSDQFLTFWLA